jgi:hypothetical protein
MLDFIEGNTDIKYPLMGVKGGVLDGQYGVRA